MRIAAIGALLLLLQSCSTTPTTSQSPYQQPNSLMTGEIDRRVEQIPYQHRDELLQNLLWLAQTGEQTIPALLRAVDHESPKVRSSAAWVLGRIADRRTIPSLQGLMRDSDQTVRTEAARSLVTMGDLKWSPALIEGLDSDKKEVRYMCHEALKTSTGHDFGYDHLSLDNREMKVSVLRWRQWWSEYSGDTMFAQSYQQKHDLQPQVAAPTGETKVQVDTAPQTTQPVNNAPDAQPNSQPNSQPNNQSNQAPSSNEPMPPAGNPAPTPVPGSQLPAAPAPAPVRGN